MARKKGSCRICKKIRFLDPHHIISRGHAIKNNQKELITNQGNIVYICRKCHNQTSASKSRYRMMMQGKERKVETIEIEKLKTKLISKRSFRKIQNMFETSFVSKNSNMEGIANSLAKYHLLYGDVNLINNEIDIYRSVTREEIQEVAKLYLNKNQRLELKYLPKNNQ